MKKDRLVVDLFSWLDVSPAEGTPYWLILSSLLRKLEKLGFTYHKGKVTIIELFGGAECSNSGLAA